MIGYCLYKLVSLGRSTVDCCLFLLFYENDEVAAPGASNKLSLEGTKDLLKPTVEDYCITFYT